MRNVPVECRQVRITTSAPDPHSIEVRVRDTGKGIDPNTANKIFEPFYTTKKDGMGMGLSISRSIIESHGGTLRAENMPGGGAEFSFVLNLEKNGEET
jgi:two-component system sensor kinase FixL